MIILKDRFANSIEPWITLEKGDEAVAFYKAAFQAVETYRLDAPDGGMVVRLSVNGAAFWISSPGGNENPLGGDNVRMILITAEPDMLFNNAVGAGAKEVFPVGEGHGWRLGRLADPFGLHWEIGYQLD